MTITIDTDVLARTTRAQILTPGHPGYDAGRRSYNAMLDRQPAVIVRPFDIEDVATTVRWAVDTGLGVAVRGGGHSVAGHSVPDGACVIDLRYWRGGELDPATMTIEALGGSLLMDLDVATAGHSRAVPSGTFFDTGIAGLTLGGGISYLLASEGFACDALVGAELVTADGRILQVDATSEPDLLWALRGGGGNFGIVTRFRYRTTPVGMFQSGPIRFMGPRLLDAITTAIELDANGPDELTTQLILWRAPGMGEPGLTVSITWRGDADGLAAELAPLRRLDGLVEDLVRPMAWLQVQARNSPIPFGMRHYWKGHLVGSAPTAYAEALLAAVETAPFDAEAEGGRDFILVELIHGAAHRIPAETASFGGRAAVANTTALTIWEDPAHDDAQVAWARHVAASIEPYSLTGGGYLNYPEVDQSAARVAAAFGPSFGRLQSIKRVVDPGNVFRFNANIPPR